MQREAMHVAHVREEVFNEKYGPAFLDPVDDRLYVRARAYQRVCSHKRAHTFAYAQRRTSACSTVILDGRPSFRPLAGARGVPCRLRLFPTRCTVRSDTPTTAATSLRVRPCRSACATTWPASRCARRPIVVTTVRCAALCCVVLCGCAPPLDAFEIGALALRALLVSVLAH